MGGSSLARRRFVGADSGRGWLVIDILISCEMWTLSTLAHLWTLSTRLSLDVTPR
jgi:hypothetical protein